MNGLALYHEMKKRDCDPVEGEWYDLFTEENYPRVVKLARKKRREESAE